MGGWPSLLLRPSASMSLWMLGVGSVELSERLGEMGVERLNDGGVLILEHGEKRESVESIERSAGAGLVRVSLRGSRVGWRTTLEVLGFYWDLRLAGLSLYDSLGFYFAARHADMPEKLQYAKIFPSFPFPLIFTLHSWFKVHSQINSLSRLA